MHQLIVDQMAGKYPSDDRSALFASFLSIAVSHHEAIMILVCHDRLIGSAFALLRPLVETAYRGLFVYFQATSEQVEKIKKGGEPYPKFNDLAASLDTLFETDGLFIQYAGDAWKTMNGYTHSGLEQLGRRINADRMLGAHFESAEIENLLQISTSLLVRAVPPFLQAMNRSEAASEVSKAFIDLYPVPADYV
jgi:hypothetical protein